MKPNEVPQSIRFVLLSFVLLGCAGCDKVRNYGGPAEEAKGVVTFTVRYAPKADQKIQILDTNGKEFRPCKLCDAEQEKLFGGSNCPKAKLGDGVCLGLVRATTQHQTSLIINQTTHSPMSCVSTAIPGTTQTVELGCWCFRSEVDLYGARCTWFYN